MEARALITVASSNPVDGDPAGGCPELSTRRCFFFVLERSPPLTIVSGVTDGDRTAGRLDGVGATCILAGEEPEGEAPCAAVGSDAVPLGSLSPGGGERFVGGVGGGRGSVETVSIANACVWNSDIVKKQNGIVKCDRLEYRMV